MFEMFYSVMGWHWAYPLAFLLLPLPWMIRRFLVDYVPSQQVVRMGLLNQFFSRGGQKASPNGQVRSVSLLERVIRSLVWLAIIVTVASPYRYGPMHTEDLQLREVLLSLDVSGSMDTRDVLDSETGERMSRMDAVIDTTAQFIDSRPDDRIGLSVFGGQAFPLVPFSNNQTLLKTQLKQIYPGIAGDQTAIGDAIGTSIRLFEQNDIEEKLLILLTDGNDNSSQLPLDVAIRLAIDNDITIHTIAFGQIATENTPLNEDTIDIEALERISKYTGGKVFTGQSREDLQQIFEVIDDMIATDVETTSWAQQERLFMYPLGFALVLLLIMSLLVVIKEMRKLVVENRTRETASEVNSNELD
ncbi:VWA domain-containing protein [Vibrio gigantis]|uniref:VWA domain-containing protein n=1 Tax=Vibrio gigantis TaxID=296199 RepID=UPI002FCB7035